VDFSLIYELASADTSDGGVSRTYQQFLEQVKLADRLGYRAVWLTEHHFLPGFSFSSAPELMLTMAGTEPPLVSIFCSAIKPPKVVVFAHEASSIAALGAAALAHSTSMAASASSPVTPGSVQVPPAPGAGFLLLNSGSWILDSWTSYSA
jgi:hypothetical protein